MPTDSNILLNAPTELGGQKVATLLVGDEEHEKVIAEFLVAGVPQTVDASNPFPVTDAAAAVSLASIDTKLTNCRYRYISFSIKNIFP